MLSRETGYIMHSPQMMDILKEEYQEITDGKEEARSHQKSMETAVSPTLFTAF